MVGCCGGAWNAIERVKGFGSYWSIKEEDISIGVGYQVLERYSPKFGIWTAPSFEDRFFRNSDVGCFFNRRYLLCYRRKWKCIQRQQIGLHSEGTGALALGQYGQCRLPPAGYV